LILSFDGEGLYKPYTADIPRGWEDVVLYQVDFTGNEKGYDLLVDYLRAFRMESCDSLILYPGDTSYKLFIGLYKEIASRMPAEQYRFLNWFDFIAQVKGAGYHGDQVIVDTMCDSDFLFVFDVVVDSKDAVALLSKLVEYTFNNRIITFVCTRMDAQRFEDHLTADASSFSAKKFLRLGLHETRP
jgi:hypothetical protein